MTPDEITDLARELAFRMAPDALLDAADVGSMLKCQARYVMEEYVHAPGFPTAIRLTLPNGARARPRWERSAISLWITSHREGKSKRGGRPRAKSDS